MSDADGGDRDEVLHRLEAFLASRDARFDKASVTSYSVLTGGYSRLMAQFTIAGDGEPQQFVLRGKAPSEQSIFDTDLAYEWAVLTTVSASSIATPTARWFDAEGTVLGVPAVVIDFQDGAPLTRQGAEDADDVRAEVCALAASVHAVDVDDLPAVVARPASWDAYVDERIARLRAIERAHVERDPFLSYLCVWLDRNRPTPAPLTLIHGDFQAPNILVGDDGALSLVDWELARIGDPREDLGRFKLAGAATPPDLVGGHEEAFCAEYRRWSGLPEAVVNPASVAYFSIVGAIDGFAMILPQLARFSTGEIGSVLVGYLSNALPFLHHECLAAAASVDQASSSLGSS